MRNDNLRASSGLRFVGAIFLALTFVPGASAQNPPAPVGFVAPEVFDLLQFLPPAPANDSEKTRAELAEVLAIQGTRTPEMVARCLNLDEAGVWGFAEVLGPVFAAETLPGVAAFFSRVSANNPIFQPARNALARQRPYQFSELVVPAGERASSFGYPSGTSTNAILHGIVLSNMLPELRSEIMELAWEMGDCRVVLGVHYPSDVEMGRITGFLFAQAMMGTTEFQAEFEAARNELVAARAR